MIHFRRVKLSDVLAVYGHHQIESLRTMRDAMNDAADEMRRERQAKEKAKRKVASAGALRKLRKTGKKPNGTKRKA